MVNTRSTAGCGLDAAGVTDRIHRSSGSRVAVPEHPCTRYMVVVMILL